MSAMTGESMSSKPSSHRPQSNEAKRSTGAMKRIAHHRHTAPSPLRPAATRDIFHDEMNSDSKGITFMPIMVRISALRLGDSDSEPQFMTAIDLRESLIFALGADEARIAFVCRQVEETGSCELGDDQSTYRLEKVLHA
ncbi:hypothetical protein [Pararhizobium sp. O133]|uniref:hypothetical protein n=1 Tax=Pararhizobium sp. O133 TaxID=3449278 RepID=UPI003F686992